MWRQHQHRLKGATLALSLLLTASACLPSFNDIVNTQEATRTKVGGSTRQPSPSPAWPVDGEALELDHSPWPGETITYKPSFTPTLSPTPSPTLDPRACIPDQDEIEYGLVRWVTDGDTIVVEFQDKLVSVRYLGIDAPEDSAQTDPFGPSATRRNSALVLNRVVQLVRDGPESDRYGQLLRYVLVEDLFVNDQLLREGLARAVANPTEVACAQSFKTAEGFAQRRGVGMWTAIAMLSPAPTASPPQTASPVLTAWPPLVSSLTPTSTSTPMPTPSRTATSSGTPGILPTSTHTRTPTPAPPVARSPTPTRSPTPGQALTPSATPIFNAQIVAIFYGEGEYALLKNIGFLPVNLESWRLRAENSGVEVILASYVLWAGETCRVYTNEDHPDGCGTSFESPTPVWKDGGDCGYLYDSEGLLISKYCF